MRTYASHAAFRTTAARPFFLPRSGLHARPTPFFMPTPASTPPVIQAKGEEPKTADREGILPAEDGYAPKLHSLADGALSLPPPAETSGPSLQTKLAVGTPNDRFEREADAVADQVVQRVAANGMQTNATPRLQMACAACGHAEQDMLRRQPQTEEEEETLQAKGAGEAEVPPAVQQSLAQAPGTGQAMAPAVQKDLEGAFGMDFSGVRLHTGGTAQEMNRQLQARAFTYGRDIYFGANEFNTKTQAGRHLLAHELTHVVQQNPALRRQPRGAATALSTVSDAAKHVARNSGAAQSQPEMPVSYVTVYLGAEEDYIDFHTRQGLFRYRLDQEGLEPGEYTASVVVRGTNVHFTLNAPGGGGRFTYRLEPDKPNPARFFVKQSSVVFTITRAAAPASVEDAAPAEQDNRDPRVQYLTLEEAMQRCQSGDLPGVKVFPYRGTRFGAAPLMAHRDGNDIIVKQPVYVLANTDFQAQTRTLPTETFIGGVRLQPNEIVRVHTYEPRWYHLNITGSTAGDVEAEFCVTGEQMLQLAAQSTLRTILNIGITAVEAATLFVPVGRIATMIGRPVVQLVGRGSRNLAIAIMLGLREASPTAFAGIASRAPIVLIEEQAVEQVASRAISQTLTHATVEFGEQAVAQTAARTAEAAAVQTGAREAIARTVAVTVVDAAGHQATATLTTPTGDAALDAMLDQAFSHTFDTTASQAASQAAQQGASAVAPEIAAGFTQAQVQAFRRLLAKPLSHQDIQVLGQLWSNAARAGDNAILNAGNSRYLFNLHRNRFWSAVRNNPTARAIFEDAGCQFSGGAPYYMLNGRRITMTIDHIIERQTAPNLALTAANLRIAFSRENSVVLRLINQLDPFQ